MRAEGDIENWVRWHLYRRWKGARRHKANQAFRTYLRRLPPGALAIDCGANVGNVTALLRRRKLRVIAFEPDPVALRVLRQRFSNDSGVVVIDKAVGAADRRASFYQRPEAVHDIRTTTGSSLIQKPSHGGTPVGEVEVVDLPRFIGELGEPVALLKVDIEGAEAELLEAMLGSGMHRAIGRIFVETHERFSAELAQRIGRIRAEIARSGIDNIDLDWL